MEIQAFGRLADIIENERINLEGAENTDQLRKKLISNYLELSEIDFAIAVNNQIIHGNCPLQKEDVVSLLPPFSGG